ncbi:MULTISPECIES: 4Fe-4S binding protein [Bacteroides]|uniref:4Fe-4S binding protein n=2 Tax=Bacteroidaceae TaxID=815 RepID=A0ABT7VKH6_9BACE|nr:MULTISPECIES: 4Fe-4S binding protein [Bacteroides]MBU3855049.1 4Fe-4S binding protein [Candidatus Phocaeicola excrementipullorum]MBW9199295.1 4Fe-4S dicluster domain-containing protein [Bacteroidales bacterium SW299]MCR8919006.1 4Fe-4S binding protein [Bacteroides sp. ET225]MDM8326185.1 4Fe-4S binding protein [Bacteroides gallinaceum]
MSSLKEYLEGYAGGVKSLLTGMGTSMKVFCQKKITEQYPENRHTTLHIPERHRALLTLPADEEGNHKCIACGLCQMNCPNGTIKLTTEMRETEEGKKKKVLVKYEYNLGSCMFCMLCVNVCPHDAIKFTNDFENAVFEKDKLVLTLNKK